MIDQLGKIHSFFVLGKARATPLKHVSVSRIELTAAFIPAKISAYLERELKYESVAHYCWMDSKVVIVLFKTRPRGFMFMCGSGATDTQSDKS